MKERNLFLNKIHLQFNSCNMGRYSFTHPWMKILYTNTHTKLLLVRRKQKEKQKGKKRQKILYHSCFIPGKKKSSNIILPTSVARWNTYLFTASQKKKKKKILLNIISLVSICARRYVFIYASSPSTYEILVYSYCTYIKYI